MQTARLGITFNMNENDKENQIYLKISEITGFAPELETTNDLDSGKAVEYFKIQNILILSNSYNFFLLEEEGRLQSLFSEMYSNVEGINPPEIIHVESVPECLEQIKKNNFEILIIFNKPHKNDILKFIEKAKSYSPKTKIILLWNNEREINQIIEKDCQKTIDDAFTWNGDGNIVLSIKNLIEDRINSNDDLKSKNRRCILLVEDSVQYYSSYIPLIYDEIFKYSEEILSESLHRKRKMRRYLRKPFLIHAKDFDTGRKYYERYKDNIIGIITDNNAKGLESTKNQKGAKFAQSIIAENPNISILVQSSEPINDQKYINKNINFILKNSPQLQKVIRSYIKKSLGPAKLKIQDKSGKVIFIIKNIKDLENLIISQNASIIKNAAKKYQFSRWLLAREEIELSREFNKVEKEIIKGNFDRQKMLTILEELHYATNQVSISNYSPHKQEPRVKISRIGKGALGGKARGLAFLAKIISKYMREDMFPGLKITIPRTIVLSTDVFDTFIDNNELMNSDLLLKSDDRIASIFMKADLPSTVLGDLRSFVRNTRKPLIIRSSGVLEDSLLQPFAGIYASMLLPNESWETDLRFQEVCNSIKYVYASTYFEKSRTYIKSTPKNIGDEKMSVIIQEVVGTKHGNYFYPTISGVAKSYNYYPSGPCTPEDGIVYLALGLGKAIVDGGSTYCFSPKRPKTPMCGTPKDFIRYSQTSFFAINLRSVYRIVNKNEETTLEKLDVDIARKHGVLDKIASTYLQQDDSLCPGVIDEGFLIIDFSPIINYDSIPLAKALNLLISISEIALGYPVEIEFAVNIFQDDSKPAELIILQIRNMMPPGKSHEIVIEDYNSQRDICFSKNSLGHGIIDGIRDLVFIYPEDFDMANSTRVVNQIRALNSKLMNDKRPYILVGPGRWGTADPWLGIPVIWSDIAGAKVIVETPYKHRTIEPSQGSHFFHDMMSSQVAYFITEEKRGNIKWNWLNSLPLESETEDVRHVKLPYELEVKIDGKTGRGVIRKKRNKK